LTIQGRETAITGNKGRTFYSLQFRAAVEESEGNNMRVRETERTKRGRGIDPKVRPHLVRIEQLATVFSSVRSCCSLLSQEMGQKLSNARKSSRGPSSPSPGNQSGLVCSRSRSWSPTVPANLTHFWLSSPAPPPPPLATPPLPPLPSQARTGGPGADTVSLYGNGWSGDTTNWPLCPTSSRLSIPTCPGWGVAPAWLSPPRNAVHAPVAALPLFGDGAKENDAWFPSTKCTARTPTLVRPAIMNNLDIGVSFEFHATSESWVGETIEEPKQHAKQTVKCVLGDKVSAPRFIWGRAWMAQWQRAAVTNSKLPGVGGALLRVKIEPDGRFVTTRVHEHDKLDMLVHRSPCGARPALFPYKRCRSHSKLQTCKTNLGISMWWWCKIESRMLAFLSSPSLFRQVLFTGDCENIQNSCLQVHVRSIHPRNIVLEVLPPSDEALRRVKPMCRLYCKRWVGKRTDDFNIPYTTSGGRLATREKTKGSAADIALTKYHRYSCSHSKYDTGRWGLFHLFQWNLLCRKCLQYSEAKVSQICASSTWEKMSTLGVAHTALR